MKKTLLYSLAVMAGLVLASCNGDYDDWASPQSYGPESATNQYGVTFAAGPDASIVMPVRNDDVRLVALTASDETVTDYAVKSVTINGEEISATVEKGYIVVSAAELSKLIEKQNNSRAAVARTFEVTSQVSVILENGDAVTINTAGTTSASLTPKSTPAIDEKGYYLLGGFEGNGWSLATPIWMTRVSDGVYTATVNTTDDGDNWYKFYEGSHYDASNWDEVNLGQMGCAVNGDNSLTGFVVYTGDDQDVQTPVISGKGTFEITLDMNNLVYTVKRAEAMYYVVGTPQGWSDSDKSCMFYALGDNKYEYTTTWTSNWDLKVWDSKTFGNWDLCWGSSVDGTRDASGSLINSNAQAFASPAAGYYTLTIDMNTQTYEWTAATPSTEYTSVSLIGDFNSWGSDIDLKQVEKAPHNWYGRATIPSGGGLKFRANHDWAVSWGTTDKETAIGDVYYLPAGNDNINVPAGTYDFYLNDITGHWNIVPVE